MITFICKKGVDYTKYGFVEDKKEWTTWTSFRKLTIKKATMTLHFNLPNLDDMKIFYEMIKDGVVVWKDIPRNKGRKHYLNLDDEEYKLIQERRKKAYEQRIITIRSIK